MKESHDYLNIAEVMTDITDNYRIDLLKITHTVTDNASNFGKSFRTFSNLLNFNRIPPLWVILMKMMM